MTAAVTLLALLTDALVGYPDRLVQLIGHPVTWMGRLTSLLDGALNRDDAVPATRRTAGVAAMVVIVGTVGAVTFGLERALLLLPFGIVAVAFLAATLLAQRSLHAHVA